MVDVLGREVCPAGNSGAKVGPLVDRVDLLSTTDEIACCISVDTGGKDHPSKPLALFSGTLDFTSSRMQLVAFAGLHATGPPGC